MVVFVTSARYLCVLATCRGKVINQRDANPCKEGNALARRRELEGCGFASLLVDDAGVGFAYFFSSTGLPLATSQY